MVWPGRRMSTGQRTSWEDLRDMGFRLPRKRHRSEGSAGTLSVKVVGQSPGEIGGDQFLKGNGDAADVVYLRWYELRCDANLVKERPLLFLPIGIEFRLDCSCWRRDGLVIRSSKKRWRLSERMALERSENGF